MRIILDLQEAQSESRFRDRGRYGLSLAQALVQQRGKHEIIIVLSGLFPETIEPIRTVFHNLLPPENIKVWYTPRPVLEKEAHNSWHHQVAKHMREAFLCSLQADIIHNVSLFEGFSADTVNSVGVFNKTIPNLEKSALTTIDEFEKLQAHNKTPLPLDSSFTIRENLIQAIAKLKQTIKKKKEWPLLAQCIAQNFPDHQATRQLLVDISEIHQSDSKSGIQRVVRSLLLEWLTNPPKGFRVEPIYLDPKTNYSHYRYAKKYTLDLLNISENPLPDDTIELQPGDIFIAPDLCDKIIYANIAGAYRLFQELGIKKYFIVYDLIPIRMPETFPPDAKITFDGWLKTAHSLAEGLICISQSVKDDLEDWLLTETSLTSRTVQIDYFHLGSNIANSRPSTGLPDNAEKVLSSLNNHINFLMVGTLEPRKGHAQVLAAFELLWKTQTSINLIIVGKKGWMVDSLINTIEQHPELNKRLFWFNSISDEYLEKIYTISTALIAASLNEGFGLPLIEAAQHKLPLIVRDIPAFKEVSKKYAYYFEGNQPEDLATAIEQWILLYKDQKHPSSTNMPYLSWSESAQQLLQKIMIS